MKLTLTVFLSVLLFAANAQFSVSGGYIRRTEDSPLNLPAHFGTSKSGSHLNLYNVASIQGMYQTKANTAFSIKFGGFPQQQVDYRFRQSHSWGGGIDGIHNYTITKRSTIIYYGLNLGLGLSFLFRAKNPKERKITSETRIGALVQFDATFTTSEKNHSTYFHEYYTPPETSPNPATIVFQDSVSYASFQSIAKNSLFSSLGITVNERIVFKQHYFLELQVSFSITSALRLNGIQEKSSNYYYEYDERFDNVSVDEYNNHRPILETGIGIGYVFNRKKEQPTNLTQ